jgi:beta-N-acetylhexosaminidase
VAPEISPQLTRRAVLEGLALGGVAAFLAACGPTPTPAPATGSPVPSRASSRPSASSSAGPSAPASNAPSASAAPPSIQPSPSPLGDLPKRIAGLLIVGFRGQRLADAPWLETAITKQGLGGVILFDRDQLTGRDRNIASPDQVLALSTELLNAAGTNGLIIGVDQEGGIVTRLGPKHGFPPLASQATIGAGSVAAARIWARTLAGTVASAGCNLDFAPVVDLDINPTNPAIGALDRSFSADPAVVTQFASIELDALRAVHVQAAVKHFPGIGSATVNTDFGVADVTKTWSRTELEPYRKLQASGRLHAVMVGHVVNGQIDEGTPASLSRATIDLLRGDIGFKGAVITDDMQAAAITRRYGADEAILRALEAGDDLLLIANQQVYSPGIVTHVVKVVLAAVAHGRLTEAQINEKFARRQALLGLAG